MQNALFPYPVEGSDVNLITICKTHHFMYLYLRNSLYRSNTTRNAQLYVSVFNRLPPQFSEAHLSTASLSLCCTWSPLSRQLPYVCVRRHITSAILAVFPKRTNKIYRYSVVKHSSIHQHMHSIVSIFSGSF